MTMLPASVAVAILAAPPLTSEHFKVDQYLCDPVGSGAGAVDYEIARRDASRGRCAPMSFVSTPGLLAQVSAAPASSHFYQVLAANDCGTTAYH